MDTRDAKLLQKTLVIKYDNHEYEFKIPSFNDRLLISSLSASLQRKFDPDGNGTLVPDLMTANLFEAYANFKHLLVRTDATWVYSNSNDAKPEMDIKNWPDDVPIVEIVRQFYSELATFREGGDKPK